MDTRSRSLLHVLVLCDIFFVYRPMVVHVNHTHLTYVLELHEIPGEVQEAFNIKAEGRFVTQRP